MSTGIVLIATNMAKEGIPYNDAVEKMIPILTAGLTDADSIENFTGLIRASFGFAYARAAAAAESMATPSPHTTKTSSRSPRVFGYADVDKKYIR